MASATARPVKILLSCAFSSPVRALVIEEENHSATPQVFVGLNHFARTAYAGGREDLAEEVYRWALDVSQSAVGPDSANTAFLLSEFDRCLQILERGEEADHLSDG